MTPEMESAKSMTMTTERHGGRAWERVNAGQRDAEDRIKRLIVIGSLATFVGFFGLTVTSDLMANADDVSAAGPSVTTTQNSPEQRPVTKTHVRTKSS